MIEPVNSKNFDHFMHYTIQMEQNRVYEAKQSTYKQNDEKVDK